MSARIIVVEDEALIATEIISSLKLLGHSVVGHAMNGDKALDLFASREADLILLDISIKGTKNGIDLARIIRDKYKIPFIYLTSYSDKSTLDQVKETMPYGYIVKPFSDNDLKVNIELALHKYSAEKESSEFTKSYVETRFGVTLTDREFSILVGFKEGKTYKEIAAQNFISKNTVKTYQKRLFNMFKVSSKFELSQRF